MATVRHGVACVELRLRDGRTTTIPVGVLAVDRDRFVRELQDRLQPVAALQPALELAHELFAVDREHSDRDRRGPAVPEPELDARHVVTDRGHRVLHGAPARLGDAGATDQPHPVAVVGAAQHPRSRPQPPAERQAADHAQEHHQRHQVTGHARERDDHGADEEQQRQADQGQPDEPGHDGRREAVEDGHGRGHAGD